MPKRKPNIKIESYGRYSKWDRSNRELPKILEFTDRIEAFEGNEFGMILHITNGKGEKLDYRIKHPPFFDKNGNPEPDFTGEYFVKSNDYRFFIGDSIWLPLENKTGTWQVLVKHRGIIVAEKYFAVVLTSSN